jgi:hypothetical protein
MNPAILNSQFVQVALPIVLTIFIAAWINGRGVDRGLDGVNKAMGMGFDGVNKRFDDVNRRLDRIEAKLDNHSERIVKLEAQASPIVRR